MGWVLELADVEPGLRVLDVGCGNGAYLRTLLARGIDAVGCDLSLGMLRSAGAPRLVNADVTALPWCDDAFDVVLAPHMLYHVPDRVTAARELRRVLATGGSCIVVTNGARHIRALRDLVEAAAGHGTPGWEMLSPSTHAFSLENGAEQLAGAFASVRCLRVDGAAPVILRDASIAADYVASVGDVYGPEIDRPWCDVVENVRAAVQETIDEHGSFVIEGDTGAFVCR